MSFQNNLLYAAAYGCAAISMSPSAWAQAGATGAAAGTAKAAAVPKPTVPAANVPRPGVVNPVPAGAAVRPSVMPRGIVNNAGLQPLMINGRFIQPNGQVLPAANSTTGLPANRAAINQLSGTRVPSQTPINQILNPANPTNTNAASANTTRAGAITGNFPNNPAATQGSVSLGQNQAQATANLQAAGTPSLQTQLGLSNSQVGQLNQFQAAYNQELASLSNRFASDPQGTTSLINTAGQQLQQNINSVLTPAQRQSLSQMTGQSNPFSGAPVANVPTTGVAQNAAINAANGPAANAGAAATNQSAVATGQAAASGRASIQSNLQNSSFSTFSDPAVQQRLNLSGSQLTQLRQFQLQHIQSMGELAGRFQSDPQGTLSLFNTMSQQTEQQISSVLTPQQQQILSSINGQAGTSTQVPAPSAATAPTGSQ